MVTGPGFACWKMERWALFKDPSESSQLGSVLCCDSGEMSVFIIPLGDMARPGTRRHVCVEEGSLVIPEPRRNQRENTTQIHSTSTIMSVTYIVEYTNVDVCKMARSCNWFALCRYTKQRSLLLTQPCSLWWTVLLAPHRFSEAVKMTSLCMFMSNPQSGTKSTQFIITLKKKYWKYSLFFPFKLPITVFNKSWCWPWSRCRSSCERAAWDFL